MEEISQAEINPGQASTDEFFLSQKAVKFLQIGNEGFLSSLKSSLEGVVLIVAPINKFDIVGMEILIDSMNSSQGNLLISISS